MTTETADIIPLHKVREPVCSHLRNLLQIVLNFTQELPHMSEQSIANHAPGDICAMRDRAQAALDIIEEVKELLADSNTMTQSSRSVAIARIKAWL